MKVSVVVPVYNPGRYITDLIDSLRAQTLDAGEWEAVLVDDGSTDDTPALLDRVAAETPNLRVIHTPNSGWPGRPRNLGIDAARGEYVFLADHDDRLDPRALERLTAFADEHGSDVVVGRIVGVGRGAPQRIFARTLVDAQRDPGLLMTSLTPQKLYRRAFLVDRDIRFPEGRRRLEDHLFVTKAYLRAARVSVYADHPVYYFVLRDDGRNASRRKAEWRGYYANVAESIEVVDAEAPDEATRVVMRRRWLRREALSRLRGAAFLERGDDRDALIESVRDLLQRFFRQDELDALGVEERIVARLLLDGRDDDLLAFAAWEASLTVRPEVLRARIDPGAAALAVAIRVTRPAAAPLPTALAGPRPGLPAPAEIAGIVALPAGARVGCTLRAVGGGGPDIDARVEQTVAGGVVEATARFDLRPIPPEGRWRLHVTVRGAGSTRVEPATVPAGARPAVAADPVRAGARRLVLAVGDRHRLLLRAERTGIAAAVRRGASRARGLVRAPRALLGRVRRRARRIGSGLLGRPRRP